MGCFQSCPSCLEIKNEIDEMLDELIIEYKKKKLSQQATDLEYERLNKVVNDNLKNI